MNPAQVVVTVYVVLGILLTLRPSLRLLREGESVGRVNLFAGLSILLWLPILVGYVIFRVCGGDWDKVKRQ